MGAHPLLERKRECLNPEEIITSWTQSTHHRKSDCVTRLTAHFFTNPVKGNAQAWTPLGLACQGKPKFWKAMPKRAANLGHSRQFLAQFWTKN
jgi:hypothetical protein